MNQIVGQFLPGHGSRIHIVSLDIFRYIDLLNKSEWSGVVEYLLEGVHQLVKSDIDFLLVCSNTGRYFLIDFFFLIDKLLLYRPYRCTENQGILS
jgi:aspartate/glutamate racemase